MPSVDGYNRAPSKARFFNVYLMYFYFSSLFVRFVSVWARLILIVSHNYQIESLTIVRYQSCFAVSCMTYPASSAFSVCFVSEIPDHFVSGFLFLCSESRPRPWSSHHLHTALYLHPSRTTKHSDLAVNADSLHPTRPMLLQTSWPDHPCGSC